MKPGSEWKLAGSNGPEVRMTFDGQELFLRENENLAGELLAAGVSVFRRTAVSGAPRGPFCMMGACFDCLVELDGVNVQACMKTVTPGMVLRLPATRYSVLETEAHIPGSDDA